MKDKKKKRPKSQQTFGEWYKGRNPLKQRAKNSLPAIIGIPVSIFLVFFACTIFIGDDLHAYSDDTYEYIKYSVKMCTGKDIGFDALKLREYLSEDGIDDFIFKQSFALRGIDEKLLKSELSESTYKAIFNSSETKKDDLKGSFYLTYENGQDILVCFIRHGFFNAELKVTLSDNYEPISFKRNFNSFQHYKFCFYSCLGAFSVVVGVILWAVAMLSWEGILFLTFKKKSPSAEAEASSNTAKNTDNGDGSSGCSTEITPA